MLRAIAALAIVMIAVSCASPLVSPSPDATSPASRPSGSEPASLTPSASALPSRDADGLLVVARLAWGDLGPSFAARYVTVLADGRVIETRNVSESGYSLLEVRQLTLEGVDWLLTTMLETSLFTGDRTLEPIFRFGESPLLTGAGHAIVVWDGDRKATVTRNVYMTTVEETPELAQFEALLAVLSDLEAALPEAMWAESTPRPYLASRFEVCVERSIRVDPQYRPAVDVDDVAWPIGVLSESWGGPGHWTNQRCGVVEAVTAHQILAVYDEALVVAGAPPRPEPSIDAGLAGVTLAYDWAAQLESFSVSLQPLLPDQDRSTSD